MLIQLYGLFANVLIHLTANLFIHTKGGKPVPAAINLIASEACCIQSGREVTVQPDNTHLRLNISLHSTARSTM